MGGGWFSKEPEVFIDEGGLRCLVEAGPLYVPFARIQNVRLVAALIGRPTLFVAMDDGATLNTELPASVDAASIEGVVLERSRRARATSRAAAGRRGDLAMWIATVTAGHLAHQAGDAYRARSIDTELLEQTLANPDDEIGARAAAAHALMKAGCRDVVARLVGKSSPPMVIVAVRLAKGGDAIVSEAMLAAALPFLELRDRVVFEQRCRVA